MLRRIILFTGITLVAMILLITFATRTVLTNGFSRLEADLLVKNLQQVENALSDELDALGMTASDWAEWDQTRQFVHDRNRSYIRSNIDSRLFEHLRLGFVLFLDAGGQELYAATFRSGSGTQEGIPAGLRDWLSRHPLMTRLPDRLSRAKGIIALPDQAILAAARPVMDPKRAGPVLGTLLMGRFIDNAEVDRLSRNLMVSLSLTPLVSQPAPPVQSLAPAGPLGGTLASVDASREDILEGTSILKGADGAPALLMKIDFPRDIHRQGITTLRYFIFWLLVIGIVFSAVVLLVLQLTVLSRLGQLSKTVLAISTGTEPGRRVPTRGRDQIAYLGAAINGMLEALEGSNSRLRQSELRNEAFLDAIPDLILRMDRDGRIVDVRFPQRSPLGETPSQVIGVPVTEMARMLPFVPEKLLRDGHAAIVQALESRLPIVMEFSVDPGKGMQHFVGRFVASGDSEVTVLVREVTAEKRLAETEKREVLVKEIHHRVKNNLQVISSLLGLQASVVRDPGTRALLDESRNRVRSMALIHEKLYQGSSGGYRQYIRDLADHLLTSYTGESGRVTIGIETDDIPMDIDLSVAIGLIINELLTNALGHAFPEGRRGAIVVSMKRAEAGLVELSVSDNGIGFPAEIDYRNPGSLGLRIVNILTQQVRGSLSLKRGEGTTFSVTFPSG